ncbi:MAG: 3-hydroxyacyl-CoA dehydrogenase [Clostridiaceae bacterium]|nr:3-hydroxyacyl-CoA dehydrogenase [Clostridiaceae bacterium]
MDIKKVVVAGGGVLGTQIAFQTAMKGFDVTIWLRSESSIGRTQPKLDLTRNSYRKALLQTKAMLNDPRVAYIYPKGLIDDITKTTEADIDALLEKVDQTYEGLKLELDLNKALDNADLLIESMTENINDKIALFDKIAPILDEKTIFVSNSSTLLPSALADHSGRPEKYLHLHFANNIWSLNIAEVMGHPGTDPKYFEIMVEFAKAIGMLPIEVHKEQAGYVLNSMLVPLLNSALGLAANGVADPKTIDLTWTRGTGAPLGPFAILDVVGLYTAYEINASSPAAKDPNSNAGKITSYLKEKIDRGETGVAAGKGFYDYSK